MPWLPGNAPELAGDTSWTRHYFFRVTRIHIVVSTSIRLPNCNMCYEQGCAKLMACCRGREIYDRQDGGDMVKYAPSNAGLTKHAAYVADNKLPCVYCLRSGGVWSPLPGRRTLYSSINSTLCLGRVTNHPSHQASAFQRKLRTTTTAEYNSLYQPCFGEEPPRIAHFLRPTSGTSLFCNALVRGCSAVC